MKKALLLFPGRLFFALCLIGATVYDYCTNKEQLFEPIV